VALQHLPFLRRHMADSLSDDCLWRPSIKPDLRQSFVVVYELCTQFDQRLLFWQQLKAQTPTPGLAIRLRDDMINPALICRYLCTDAFWRCCFLKLLSREFKDEEPAALRPRPYACLCKSC
jgi:hypothetical protein